MATQSIDLSKLFGSVVETLDENKTALNKADTYNHNHGDNMVEIFEVITQAMKAKSNATPAEQLAYASQLLQAKSQSGSAKLYAQGLQDASAKLGGKKTVTPNSAVDLLQALMGTQKKVSPQTLQSQARPTANTPDAGDLLGSLLGGLTGTSKAPASTGDGDDLLGSLLGGLTGATGSSSSQSGKIDISKLLKAGMTYMQAKQSGSNDIEAILNAVMSGSRMGTQEYRTESGTMVANTLLQTLSKMIK